MDASINFVLFVAFICEWKRKLKEITCDVCVICTKVVQKKITHPFCKNFRLNSLNTPVLSSSCTYFSFACDGIKCLFETPRSICRSTTSSSVKRTRDTPKPTARRSFNFIDRIHIFAPLLLSLPLSIQILRLK